jgi:diguanylate cyclase (GGDEF)-like protein
VLKAFAKILVGSLRSDDIAARWGGDEFIAMLSTMGVQSLESVSSRILANVESFNAQSFNDWKLGISIGHAVLGQDSANDFESLIAAADARMYQSRRDKRLGEEKESITHSDS